MPAKGPWFDTLEKPVHTDTAKMLSQRVVRLDLVPAQAASGQPASSQGKAIFKVNTNPVGFINHYTGLQTTPNCHLLLKEDVPLGEHCLVVKCTTSIKGGSQWLLNYGPQHQCGERVVRKRRRSGGTINTTPKKKKKEAATEGGDAEAEADMA